MGTVGATSSDAEERQADMAAPQVRVFINYRHDDTQGEARLLYDRLASRFGSGNLFLDVRSLQPGMKWLDARKRIRGPRQAAARVRRGYATLSKAARIGIGKPMRAIGSLGTPTISELLAKIRRPGLAGPAGNSHHLPITIPTSGVTTSRFWSRHRPFRDFRYTRKVANQPEQTVSISGQPFFDPSGRFLGYRGTARNVSDESKPSKACARPNFKPRQQTSPNRIFLQI